MTEKEEVNNINSKKLKDCNNIVEMQNVKLIAKEIKLYNAELKLSRVSDSAASDLAILQAKKNALEAHNLKLQVKLCEATHLEDYCTGIAFLKQPLHRLCATGFLHQDVPCADNEDGKDLTHWASDSLAGDLNGYCCEN